MGHSAPSLYRKTSRGCPLTKGSAGRLISRGVSSLLDPFRDPRLKAAARAFVRGLKGAEYPLLPDMGDARAEPAWEALRSDAADIVRGPIGTVRLLRLGVDAEGEACADAGLGTSSAGGAWSAGGMGRPRAAATIWCSAHVSEKSSSPRQNGASFRSICEPEMRPC